VKDNNRQGPLPDKKYLFVLLATKSCQLKFEDLVIYSFLTYRAGTKHPTLAQRRIADNLGLCRTTVRQSLGRLQEQELAHKTDDGRWHGLDPKDKSGWFVTIKSVNTAGWDWNKRFANFRMLVARPKRQSPSRDRRPDPAGETRSGGADVSSTGTAEAKDRRDRLTPRENAVLWKLHSWNTGRTLMTVTHQGLATQLCLNREAVCRAIKELKALGLVDDDLQAVVKDEDRHYWLDAPRKLRRNPKAQASKSPAETVLGWFRSNGGELAYFKDFRRLGERLDGYERALRDEGYNGADVLHYWDTVAFAHCKGDRRQFECFVLKGFPTVLRVVTEIHAVKGAGYRNSLGLLKRKTEGVVRDIRSRYERRQFDDHDPLLDWETDFGKIMFGAAALGRGQEG
jgi:biotin operon repressor